MSYPRRVCRALAAVAFLVTFFSLPVATGEASNLDRYRRPEVRLVPLLPAPLIPEPLAPKPAVGKSVLPPIVPSPVPPSLPAGPDFSLSGAPLPGGDGQLLVVAEKPLAGAILPQKRIVAFYGNPMSRRMGVLGECRKEELLCRLEAAAERWAEADPSVEVQPALHLIAVVAQDSPGRAGKYRKLMTDALVSEVYAWAREAGALLFIDIQTGHEDIRTILPRFEWILKNPDVHLGIDPEFNLVDSEAIPGTKVGSYDAVDVNAVSAWLAGVVERYHLPPKVLTVHRFTRNGVTNADDIVLRPEVQIVMHMDGWGPPAMKRATYRDYVASEPVQYTGFKLFFHNDTKQGDPLMTPEDVLRLRPRPMYIQYQ